MASLRASSVRLQFYLIRRRERGRTVDYGADDETLDRTFDLLADRRRRTVIEELRESADGVASLDDLADRVAASAPDDTDRRRARVALHHRALPKLDAAGVVDFDPRSDTVRYRGTDLGEDLLDFVAESG